MWPARPGAWALLVLLAALALGDSQEKKGRVAEDVMRLVADVQRDGAATKMTHVVEDLRREKKIGG